MPVPAVAATTVVVVPTPPISTPLWLVDAPGIPVFREPMGDVIFLLTDSGQMYPPVVAVQVVELDEPPAAAALAAASAASLASLSASSFSFFLISCWILASSFSYWSWTTMALASFRWLSRLALADCRSALASSASSFSCS